MHADDEVLLDAAADVISACCGLLACGGKVHNLVLCEMIDSAHWQIGSLQ